MNSSFAPPKLHFLGKPAPPGYVAGVGRGATGFTTRSDIGPARETAGSSSIDGGLARKFARRAQEDDDEEAEYMNDKNYDEFAGYGGSLVNKDPYEEDDEEADKIYDAIDKHLEERGKALRESKARLQLEHYNKERPKIQQHFIDLKACLKEVSEAEWMRIPDVGDARNRKQRVARQDKFTPVPDSLLAHQARIARGGEQMVYIDPKELDTANDDQSDDHLDQQKNQSEVGTSGQLITKRTGINDGTQLSIEEVSEFRSNFMKIKLNNNRSDLQTEDQASAQASKDYLTNLQSMIPPSQITDAATLKEYRKQFASLRASNPNFTNGWIASVRLEEAAGKLKAARSLILAACEQCPKSADLWCEAVRLHPQDLAKALMVRALKEIPRSVKLWIKAADLETNELARRKVFAKARELVPKSVLLWKRSIELEQPEQARTILREAIECCPEACELWLALARLLPYDEARRVLIQASEKLPHERSIWIMAAKLEEAAGNRSLVASIISRAIDQLSTKEDNNSAKPLDRNQWLSEAIDAERANFKFTCHEIVRQMIGREASASQDQEQRLKLLQDVSSQLISEKAIECARAVHECIVSDKELCRNESHWLAFAKFERDHGTSESLEGTLKRSIQTSNCLDSETLWLMLADEKRRQPDEARQILAEALDANPDSECIILAAVELECEHSNHEEARRILADACMSAKSPRLVLRVARLEWDLGNLDEAVRMLSVATDEYKDQPELYLMLANIAEQRNSLELAKSHYSNGLKFCPTSVDLWIGLSKAEEQTGNVAKARSKLEMGRLRNPRVVRLWLEAARLEVRAKKGKNASIAINILAKGIKECKGSADLELLYAEQASLGRRNQIDLGPIKIEPSF